MNVYWDSSALVSSTVDPSIRARLQGGLQWSRPHALAETFSTLTGGRLGYRVDPGDASALVAGLAARLHFIDLTAEETLEALAAAKVHGVRGGRTHDWLHAVAARKAGCSRLLTLNLSDFEGLDPHLAVESP
jgi:predicted nucleic acid-binding protein